MGDNGMSLLGRTVRWTKEGIEWEASQKIAKDIVARFERPDGNGRVETLTECNPPGDPQLMNREGSEKLCSHMSTVHVCMFPSLDRTVIAYAAKELSRWSNFSTKGHLTPP